MNNSPFYSEFENEEIRIITVIMINENWNCQETHNNSRMKKKKNKTDRIWKIQGFPLPHDLCFCMPCRAALRCVNISNLNTKIAINGIEFIFLQPHKTHYKNDVSPSKTTSINSYTFIVWHQRNCGSANYIMISTWELLFLH